MHRRRSGAAFRLQDGTAAAAPPPAPRSPRTQPHPRAAPHARGPPLSPLAHTRRLACTCANPRAQHYPPAAPLHPPATTPAPPPPGGAACRAYTHAQSSSARDTHPVLDYYTGALFMDSGGYRALLDSLKASPPTRDEVGGALGGGGGGRGGPARQQARAVRRARACAGGQVQASGREGRQRGCSTGGWTSAGGANTATTLHLHVPPRRLAPASADSPDGRVLWFAGE